MPKFQFRPVLPAITVSTVKQDDLKEIANSLHTFAGVNPKDVTKGKLKKQGFVVVDGDERAGYETRVIVEVGDFLVVSNNGVQAIAKDARILDGDFTGLPAELFTPITGTALNE